MEGVKIRQSYHGNSLEGKGAWDFVQIKHAVELGLDPQNEGGYEVITS